MEGKERGEGKKEEERREGGGTLASHIS